MRHRPPRYDLDVTSAVKVALKPQYSLQSIKRGKMLVTSISSSSFLLLFYLSGESLSNWLHSICDLEYSELYQTIPFFNDLEKSSENIVIKGRKYWIPAFFPFTSMFSYRIKEKSHHPIKN